MIGDVSGIPRDKIVPVHQVMCEGCVAAMDCDAFCDQERTNIINIYEQDAEYEPSQSHPDGGASSSSKGHTASCVRECAGDVACTDFFATSTGKVSSFRGSR